MNQSPFASQTLAVKVDVCTHAGLRDGVPALMRLFDELGIRASFFVSLGPDHSGRAIRRILRPGFLNKMLRTPSVLLKVALLSSGRFGRWKLVKPDFKTRLAWLFPREPMSFTL